MRRINRPLSTGLAAVAVAAAMVLVPATAARAAGAGWAGSWDYYVNDNYRFTATVPGVRVLGFASDSGGTRSAGVSIEDTEVDDRCAQVEMYGQRDGRLALLAKRSICDGQPAESFATGSFTGDHQIFVGRFDPAGGFQDKGFSMIVPGTAGDPDLRLAGTRASWDYYTDTSFRYTLERPGVRVVGFGSDLTSGARQALSAVTHTGESGTCAYGEVTDFINVVSATQCNPGEGANFSSSELFFELLVQACQVVGSSWRCVATTIPEPV